MCSFPIRFRDQAAFSTRSNWMTRYPHVFHAILHIHCVREKRICKGFCHLKKQTMKGFVFGVSQSYIWSLLTKLKWFGEWPLRKWPLNNEFSNITGFFGKILYFCSNVYTFILAYFTVLVPKKKDHPTQQPWAVLPGPLNQIGLGPVGRDVQWHHHLLPLTALGKPDEKLVKYLEVTGC